MDGQEPVAEFVPFLGSVIKTNWNYWDGTQRISLRRVHLIDESWLKRETSKSHCWIAPELMPANSSFRFQAQPITRLTTDQFNNFFLQRIGWNSAACRCLSFHFNYGILFEPSVPATTKNNWWCHAVASAAWFLVLFVSFPLLVTLAVELKLLLVFDGNYYVIGCTAINCICFP